MGEEKTMVTVLAQAIPLILILAGFILYFGSGVWAYRDAELRGKPPLLVCLLVLLVSWPISLLIWIALRPAPRRPPFDLNRYRVQ